MDQRILRRKNLSKNRCFEVERRVNLTSGVNLVSVIATNRTGEIESNRDSISVKYTPERDFKPDLHILAVGIDRYRDGDLWLNYSVADAKAIQRELKNSSKKLFNKIHTYELLDSEVTKDKLLAKFMEIGKKVKTEDVFIFYIAGHGVTDDLTGEYYYIPYDFRYKNDESVREHGVSNENLTVALAQIKTTKSVTLIDTCNSGSFASNRSFGMKTAVKKLVRATGRATIVASSKDQVALEGYKGHGVFTYAILEALKGKGFGSDSKMTIRELSAYVEDKVPEITFKKWQYEQVPQADIKGNDFPVAIK
ncbi:hypothetical protein ThvES_00018990 [Thiovulum sp. ES]|nr:hypothetical protein ThvES_00018990 [Thiovulum sp. ES]